MSHVPIISLPGHLPLSVIDCIHDQRSRCGQEKSEQEMAWEWSYKRSRL